MGSWSAWSPGKGLAYGKSEQQQKEPTGPYTVDESSMILFGILNFLHRRR